MEEIANESSCNRDGIQLSRVFEVSSLLSNIFLSCDGDGLDIGVPDLAVSWRTFISSFATWIQTAVRLTLIRNLIDSVAEGNLD